MKYLLVLSVLLLTSCLQPVRQESSVEIDASLNITKTDSGFNIYSNKGILLLEYTKQNCDSASLKTLEDIYQTAKEFYNKIELEENRTGTKNI